MKFEKAFTQAKPVETEHIFIGAEKALHYTPDPKITLKEYDTSPEADSIKRQFSTELTTISDFLLQHPQHVDQNAPHVDPTQPFNTFKHRINAGMNGYFSTTIGLAYSDGKRALDTMWHAVANDDIPLQTKLSELRRLPLALAVCGPGSITNLISVSKDLDAATRGVQAAAHNRIEKMVENSVQEFVQGLHEHGDLYEINEVHYVNGYRNHIADTYGINKIKDPFIPFDARDHHNLEDCAEYVAERVHPEALVRSMAEACMQAIHEHFPGDMNRPLTAEEVHGFYTKYDGVPEVKSDEDHSIVLHAAVPGFRAQLAKSFGNVDAASLIREDKSAISEEAVYRLIDTPTLLEREIARNLRAANCLEPFKFQKIVDLPERGFSIKKITEQSHYVKEKLAYGEVVHRPIDTDDLRDGRTIAATADSKKLAEMTHSAILNTRDPEKLARFPVAHVISTLEHDPSHESWVEFLTSSLRKYREASISHNKVLMTTVAKWAEKMGYEDRLDATHRALRNNDPEVFWKMLPEDWGASTIYEAAKGGHKQIVANLIKRMIQSGHADEIGFDKALTAGRTGAVKLYVDALRSIRNVSSKDMKTLLSAKDDDEIPALYHAMKSGHAETVRAFLTGLQHFQNLEDHELLSLATATHKGATSPLLVIMKEHEDTREVNLDLTRAYFDGLQHVPKLSGSDITTIVRARDENDETPFFKAMKSGDSEVVSTLMKQLRNFPQLSSKQLFRILDESDIDDAPALHMVMMNDLLTDEIAGGEQVNTISAFMHGLRHLPNIDDAELRKLLEARDDSGSTALATAMSFNHFPAVKTYIQELTSFSNCRNVPIANILSGSDAAYAPTLFAAFHNNNVESLKAYLTEVEQFKDLTDAQRYTLLQARDSNGLPGLHKAMEKGFYGAISEYMQHVSRVPNLSEEHLMTLLAAKTRKGSPALHKALENGEAEGIKAYIAGLQLFPQLSEKSLMELLTAETNSGSVGVIAASSANHKQALKAFSDGVFELDKLSEKNKYQLIELEPTSVVPYGWWSD